MLTVSQAQIVRNTLTGLIHSNNVKSDAARRTHGNGERMPPNVTYETDQRDNESAALRVVLDNLGDITEMPTRLPA